MNAARDLYERLRSRFTGSEASQMSLARTGGTNSKLQADSLSYSVSSGIPQVTSGTEAKADVCGHIVDDEDVKAWREENRDKYVCARCWLQQHPIRKGGPRRSPYPAASGGPK